MTTDNGLLEALVAKAEGYRPAAPVFPIAPRTPDETIKYAAGLSRSIWEWLLGDCVFLPTAVIDGVATIYLGDDSLINIFEASGAVEGIHTAAARREIIAPDESNANLDYLKAEAERVVARTSKGLTGSSEALRFERLWRIKAKAISAKREPVPEAPTALVKVVATFRRHLHGLPVLGRASVTIGIGGKNRVTDWSVDWRPIAPRPLAETAILDPADGARRILDDLSRRRPEKPFTREDFEPVSFQLGYFAAGRRQPQRTLQPTWVAVFRPTGWTTMGQVVAVPAGARTFEPLAIPVAGNPPLRPRRIARDRAPAGPPG
jgi:hypothetical protein